METNELLKMVDEYFDGELEKSKEQSLFISLSANQQARTYLRQNRFLKSVTSEMQEVFPEKVEKRILSRTILFEKNKFFIQKIRPVVAYAAVIILFFICLFFYQENISYKRDITRINNNLAEQNKTIESILNALPTVEVKGTIKNELKEIRIKATKL
jgi:hypothetical protein